MRRLDRIAVLVATLGASLAMAGSAQAQSEGERINQVIVYGDDPCPKSEGGDIVICARKDESERYRIPEPLRGIDSPQSEAWNEKVLAYETIGQTGTLSCSPVGAGGSTGCTQKLINAAYAERANGSDVRFSELIDAERQRRLSQIDEEAADEQARVEAAEREYFQKKAQEDVAKKMAEEAGETPND
ncbi:hypothetical protein B2G71_13150 [Novosphingobium sp. PC22D]|uniref:hypothetical protein n=1 Tax=Novosphingobium sp. PC22D TaxID=1962403 RepID=UPI000BF15EDF|nr:hypothetical protein [Novosphingobium sp. PC22D]PEQ12086.1 hypothetical protein B2G71_13150 [Novosphingobium sp. PC22D]